MKKKIKIIPCEVYSRVVGYFRPIQDWNAGKVEEFSRRKLIDPKMLEKEKEPLT
jgi:anaerobic ribonucleoside-triphosphate reductase